MKNLVEMHTFAICAYKESPYLEECVKSLVNQTVKSNIIICTSTPNGYIEKIAGKYHIEYYIRDGKSDIRDDWNYSISCSKTKYVTVAHQDDVYDIHYGEELEKCINEEDVLLFISDYLPLKKGKIGERDLNSKIKRLLRIPMKSKALSRSKWWKRRILCLGNSICCPSAAYNTDIIGKPVFTSELKFCIDWDTFLKCADMKGRFGYVDKPLIYYRIHDGATSKEFIVDNRRVTEDTYMFEKFWPSWIVKSIMKFYKKAYETYD